MHLRDTKPVERPEVENCSVTLVIDVSGSMRNITPSGKSCIEEVNDGINHMIAELSMDDKLGRTVELSIITFCDKGLHELYQGFSAVGKVSPIDLATGTTTYAIDALEMALENIRTRVKKYTGGYWKPWIVFVTDGLLMDDPLELAKIGEIIRKREQDGKLRVLCFGVPGFEPTQLKLLSDRVFQIVDYNFAEFFSWIGKSQAVVSATPTSLKGPVKLPPTNSFTQISI